jgi:hypothetical protein
MPEAAEPPAGGWMNYFPQLNMNDGAPAPKRRRRMRKVRGDCGTGGRDRTDHQDIGQRLDAYYAERSPFTGDHAACSCDSDCTAEPSAGVVRCTTFPCTGEYLLACCDIKKHTGPGRVLLLLLSERYTSRLDKIWHVPGLAHQHGILRHTFQYVFDIFHR